MICGLLGTQNDDLSLPFHSRMVDYTRWNGSDQLTCSNEALRVAREMHYTGCLPYVWGPQPEPKLIKVVES